MIPTGNGARKSNAKLQTYLHNIGWETNRFTNGRLECMLAASCLRYLGGIEDIFFVVELAQVIRRKYGEKMNLSLWYSYEVLSGLTAQLRTNCISPTDTTTINELVNDAQELITKRRYEAASNF
jgi:hypothetical protein